MDKSKVVDFFDACASGWDSEMIRDDARIEKILDFAGVMSGVKVLDVACGTGVLIPDYLARNVKSITGVDISRGMIKIAKGKFSHPNVEFYCADIEEIDLHGFDVCVVYNAFPHFENPARLIENLADKLENKGRLTIAHGMGREEINTRHGCIPEGVSHRLLESEELKKLFTPFFDVDVCLENDEIYVVSGVKKF